MNKLYVSKPFCFPYAVKNVCHALIQLMTYASMFYVIVCYTILYEKRFDLEIYQQGP